MHSVEKGAHNFEKEDITATLHSLHNIIQREKND